MTSPNEYPAAIDPAIAAFLADGGYANIEEWMEDSDCYWNDGAWWRRTYGDEAKEGDEMDPIGTIEGVMEACGWGRPTGSANGRPTGSANGRPTGRP